MTIEDAEKGRMSYPTRYDPYDVNGVDLSRDECNEQQRSRGSGWTFTDGECIAFSGMDKGQIICSI